MTQAVTQLFKQLEKLSEDEQLEFRDIFLQRHEEIVKAAYVGEDLSEEDLSAIAAESFRRLDEEENAAKAR